MLAPEVLLDNAGPIEHEHPRVVTETGRALPHRGLKTTIMDPGTPLLADKLVYEWYLISMWSCFVNNIVTI